MLKADVIEPCASPWSSNIVLVKKFDGNPRFCIDYSRLNDITCVRFRLLSKCSWRLEVLLNSGSSKWFWQVAIDLKDFDKTAFVTRRGQYRFKVLSFGLANSPSVLAYFRG